MTHMIPSQTAENSHSAWCSEAARQVEELIRVCEKLELTIKAYASLCGLSAVAGKQLALQILGVNWQGWT